jgi:hypothetical protein
VVLTAILGALVAPATGCGEPREAAPARAAAMPRSKATPATASSDLTRAGWRNRLGIPDECERGFELLADRGTGVELYRLNKGRRLAQVACAPGAYQGTYMFFVLDSAGTRAAGPIAFPDYVDAGTGAGASGLEPARTTEVVGLPSFDAATQHLTVLRKFRGLGDCGLLLTYALPGDTATLVQLRGRLTCDSEATVPPADWPPLDVRQR